MNMKTRSEWQYVAASVGVTLKFVLTEEAERARDKALMRYLMAHGEHFEGRPFSINPVALADLWAEAWHEGRVSCPREHAPVAPPPAAEADQKAETSESSDANR